MPAVPAPIPAYPVSARTTRLLQEAFYLLTGPMGVPAATAHRMLSTKEACTIAEHWSGALDPRLDWHGRALNLAMKADHTAAPAVFGEG